MSPIVEKISWIKICRDIFSWATEKNHTLYICSKCTMGPQIMYRYYSTTQRESGVVNKKQINWSNNPQIGNRDKTWGVIYMESVLSLFLFLWYNNKQLLEKQFTLLCNKNEIQCIALYQIHVDEWSHFHEHHVIFLHVKARQMSTSIYLYDLIN